MKRGSNALECGSLGGDNMISAVQRTTGINLCTPLQYADQTAALQLGHYATKSVLGAHVTRLLAETEADPGLSSFRLSEAVRKAAAAGQARRITRHNCGVQDKRRTSEPLTRTDCIPPPRSCPFPERGRGAEVGVGVGVVVVGIEGLSPLGQEVLEVKGSPSKEGRHPAE